jgi:hypothetical protein
MNVQCRKKLHRTSFRWRGRSNLFLFRGTLKTKPAHFVCIQSWDFLAEHCNYISTPFVWLGAVDPISNRNPRKIFMQKHSVKRQLVRRSDCLRFDTLCAGAKGASEGSSRQRGIDHETAKFYPVVSHLAGTPSVDCVPGDSMCALAHALGRFPHALSRIPNCIRWEFQLVSGVSQERRG